MIQRLMLFALVLIPLIADARRPPDAGTYVFDGIVTTDTCEAFAPGLRTSVRITSVDGRALGGAIGRLNDQLTGTAYRNGRWDLFGSSVDAASCRIIVSVEVRRRKGRATVTLDVACPSGELCSMVAEGTVKRGEAPRQL